MLVKNSKQHQQLQNGEEYYKSSSFLTFKIGDKLFASNVISVITKYKLDKINLVSNITPDLYKGVINMVQRGFEPPTTALLRVLKRAHIRAALQPG